MKFVKNVCYIIVFAITPIAYGAQQSQAESKQDAEKQVTTNDERPIFVTGTVRVMPNPATSFNELDKIHSSLTAPIKKTYPQLDGNETLIQLSFSSPQCADWANNYHAAIHERFCHHFPVEARVLYSVHPLVLKQNVRTILARTVPRGICDLISDYGTHQHSLLECETGTIFQCYLPNQAYKKVIAQLTCATSLGHPFETASAGAVLQKAMAKTIPDQVMGNEDEEALDDAYAYNEATLA